MVTRRDFDEGGPSLGRNALDFADESPSDATGSCADIDDQRQDSDRIVVVLEPGNHVIGDETDHAPLGIGNDDPRTVDVEARQTGCHDRRRDWVALLGEERRDPWGIGLGGLSQVGAWRVGHGQDGIADAVAAGVRRQRSNRSAIGSPTDSKPIRR